MTLTRAVMAWVSLWFLFVSCASASASLGFGDPFFPSSGDARYDVTHYDVRLAYQPASGRLHAVATIVATPLEPLSELSLDLDGLHVTSAFVDGKHAPFSRSRRKLNISPASPLPVGIPFAVTVRYRGRPRLLFEPGGLDGWIRTRDGAAALGEPKGTAAWLPCNNALPDKASFDFHMTVPMPLKAIANGRLVDISRQRGWRTYHWQETQPMDAYLAVLDVGRGRLVRGRAAGVPTWTLVDPARAKAWRPRLAELPEILRFETKLLGPYPFDAAGSIVDRIGLDGALESQTRPIYDLPPYRVVIVHEMAHQWFGDSVGLRRWPDIWLNEGFATWVQWFYREHHGGPSVRWVFRRLMRVPASVSTLWRPPPGRPGRPRYLFATSVYTRGAMALEALRIKVGTQTMLEILRDWAARHRNGSVDTSEFISMAEDVSERPLRGLFKRWLFAKGKPTW